MMMMMMIAKKKLLERKEDFETNSWEQALTLKYY
jgi:hypothetical protein